MKFKAILIFLLCLFCVMSQGLHAREKTTNQLALYSCVDADWVGVVAKKFEDETGIKVNWIRESSGVVLQRIKAEQSSPNADVWFGGTLDAHAEADKNGLLEKYISKENANLYLMFQNPLGNNGTTGVYASILGFAVNEKLLTSLGKPIPKTWDDLVDPAYKGLIGMANPTTSGTAFTVLAALVRLKGEDGAMQYLSKLHRNIAQYSESGGAPALLASRGEIAIAIVFLQDSTKYRLQGYPLKEVIPSEGTGIEIGGLSLIKAAPNTELGKKFIDWILQPRIQELAATTGAYQVQSNMHTTRNINVIPLENAKLVDLNMDWVLSHKANLLKRWTEQVFTQPKN